MRRINLFTSILVFLILLFAIVSKANAEASPVKNDVKKKDSKVALIDRNSDQQISFEEMYQYKQDKKKKKAEKQLKEVLEQCDKNHDGIINNTEIKDEDKGEYKYAEANASEKATKPCRITTDIIEFLDRNSDGELNQEEILFAITEKRRPGKKAERKYEDKLKQRKQKRKKKKFEKCDKNGDGLLSLREAVSQECRLSMHTEKFDSYDTNSDEYVSIDELFVETELVKSKQYEAYSNKKTKRKLKSLRRLESAIYDCDKDEDGQLGKHETIEEECEQDLDFFDSVDNDQDGYISLDEIERARLKKRFDETDKNKDGVLAGEELKEAEIKYY